MPPQPVILESQNATSVADGATIERRIRISQPDEGRGRCKGSRVWDPRKDFSQPVGLRREFCKKSITPEEAADDLSNPSFVSEKEPWTRTESPDRRRRSRAQSRRWSARRRA